MPKPSPRRLLPNLARCGLAVLGLALFGALAQPSSCAAAEEEYGAWFGTKPPREYPGKSVEVLREWDSDIEKPVMAVVMHETSADDKTADYRERPMSLIVVAAGANRSAAFILPDVTLPEEANVCTAHLSYDGTREERVVDFHHVPKDGDTYLALEEKLEPRTLREFLVDLLQSETLRIRFDHHGLDRSFDVGMAREFLEEQRGRSNAWQEE